MHVFDLGNTRGHQARWTNGRLSSAGPVSYDDLFKLSVEGDIAYATVQLKMGARFDRAFDARRMGRDFPAAIPNRTLRPERVGADRLANAVAAWARARRACVVVDVGTAVTFDVVNAKGEFVGGMIAPGPALQARSLHEHTSLLPEVKIDPSSPRDRRAIGRFTEEAIKGGIHAGLVGLVREGLSRVRRELGKRPTSFATGGGGALLRGCVDHVVDWLTLEGIAISAQGYLRDSSDRLA